MPLTHRQSRRFTVVFVVLALALAVLAAVLILRGMNDPVLQERVRQQETERRAQQPRLDDYPGDRTPATETP